VHDTADLEARGVPSAFVATIEFEDGAVHQAQALGADPAAIYVPHPIQDRTDEEMLKIADGAFQAVLDSIVGAQKRD
jgi:hypothetical protein